MHANSEVLSSIDSSGTYPHRRQAHDGYPDVLERQGRGIAVINFEDAQLYGPLVTRAVVVGMEAVRIPRTEYSLVAAIANTHSTATLYLGPSGVSTTNGWPIDAGEKQAFEMLANLDFYLVSDTSNTNVRILEVSSRVT